MTSSIESVAAWPLAIILGVGVVLLIVLLTRPRIFHGSRAVAQSFWCQFAQRLVNVDFRVDAWDGHRVDVEACSAFTPSHAITCEKRCLKTTAQGRGPWPLASK